MEDDDIGWWWQRKGVDESWTSYESGRAGTAGVRARGGCGWCAPSERTGFRQAETLKSSQLQSSRADLFFSGRKGSKLCEKGRRNLTPTVSLERREPSGRSGEGGDSRSYLIGTRVWRIRARDQLRVSRGGPFFLLFFFCSSPMSRVEFPPSVREFSCFPVFSEFDRKGRERE